MDGVLVVPGAAAADWRDRLPAEQFLDGAQVEQVWEALDRLARRRDNHDRVELPPSAEQLAGRALLIVTSGLLGFLASAQLLTLTVSLLVWVPSCLLLAAAAVPLRRHRQARLPALAWQTGVIATLVVAAAAAALGAAVR